MEGLLIGSVSFWRGENVLKLGCGNSSKTVSILKKTKSTDLYILGEMCGM